MQYNYLISTSADFIGNEYVPVTRVYNGNIVSDPENYNLEAGESWADEKPDTVPDGELLYDLTY